MKILQLVARIIAAAIMLQTLYFKFTAHPESVYIFSTLGIEPFGRIGSGIAELIASILLLIPKTAWMGAIMGLGVMAGAIISHLTILGIDVKNDGGQLFYMALFTFVCCLIVVFYERLKIINLASGLFSKR
ncbi:DoxX family membrane protein [Emticicia oligotrophica]|uniref:DoxX family membrane protein n=1 Tax=Emticicia oligotrophica TaxID=312279 RepID=UPI00273B7476|nr:DoxX family membrane protein [Emticicia oligotrophica]